MNVLLIFVKNPVPGRVKTRLAASVGNNKALEVYAELLAITKKAALGADAERQVWYSDWIEQNDSWDNDQFSKFLQDGDNLGERMMNAFEKAFENGAGSVVIIGSDCPAISKKHLDGAFYMLKTSEVVIGPSADGGYYLLGMKRFIPDLFSGINWSTPKVLEQTKEIVSNKNLSCSELEQLNDIDTAEDLESDPILNIRL